MTTALKEELNHALMKLEEVRNRLTDGEGPVTSDELEASVIYMNSVHHHIQEALGLIETNKIFTNATERVVVVLNDGETYSGFNGCKIVQLPEGLPWVQESEFIKGLNDFDDAVIAILRNDP